MPHEHGSTPEQLEFFEEVPEREESREGIEDVGPISLPTVSQAVVSATDWTTETVISQINKGNIQLNPRFQRRDAWDPQRKSRFIESLILGLPVPQLVLAEAKDRKGAYVVIDGKQRLLSIRQFAAEEGDRVYDRLRLSGLDIRRDLARKSLVDLRRDAELFNDLSAFENQPIRTVVIKNWQNEDFLYQVFLRLNTGSVPLSPQELRQALHPGPFVDFADIRSGESEALRELLKLRKPDFRMRDVELLVRFYAFSLFLAGYSGDLKRFLDFTCSTLNTEWNEREGEIENLHNQFEHAYRTARLVFTNKHVFRKWTGDRYETALNRAIFDVMMYYFKEPAIRQAAEEKRQGVEEAFKQLCVSDSRFLASIERTTKSLEATQTRIKVWGAALQRVLNIDLHIPTFAGLMPL